LHMAAHTGSVTGCIDFSLIETFYAAMPFYDAICFADFF